ncbi:UDP-glucose/GDP-mannose dehydrogenase family protein [Sporolactobacillus shoreae]|uniref:UDP-glucose 6-dehydrogenase n=1 Tax=Sporolactobacillus shoreae TaxID=1465501 RepID=A0A4Z0GQD0_9BACL|nr:UDP-glucose/GDP-mannose dehydrogenase family protein [Sporolactobacillus shoreae]TGA98711.1 UDP-glucose/GDP-mannose dehydrogenase family protein [Sporolactobacillus shoreae]
MKILIVGTGYVGTTTALVFCEKGHQVTGLDVDEEKIKKLQSGELHFFEPGLGELLKKHLREGNLSFTQDESKAIEENDVIFICVGTPQDKDGSADLRYVQKVAERIGENLNTYKVIVDKSTVPVGTADKVARWILEHRKNAIPFDVVSNPEFLREGSALQDALNPDRIVIGYSSEKALHSMRELYKDFACPFVETTPKTAEMIKYAANSFLALKISYINELARLCDLLGIKIDDLSKGIGLDHRIGEAFLKAGVGYGGSCFPKDVSALLKTAETNHQTLSILEAAVKVNQTQPKYFVEKLQAALGSLENKVIAVLGLAFKSNTDDIRESPSFKIIDHLVQAGAKIKAHDPTVKMGSSPSFKQVSTVEECVSDTDAIILCTDWEQYKNIDWMSVRKSVRFPFIVDGKNMLNANEVKHAGYGYYALGKS